MTTQYAIVAFPTFEAPAPIEMVRRAFDPQASLLPAHITLVFPFPAGRDIPALRTHLHTALSGVPSFDVTLAPPSVEQGEYLYLRVEGGGQRILDLHDTLYSGPLKQYLSTTHIYEPHVTVGHVLSPDALAAATVAARQSLPTTSRAHINSVCLFCIEAGTGRVDLTVPLATSGEGRSSAARGA